MVAQADTNVYVEELEETENARQESCQMRYQAVLGVDSNVDFPQIVIEKGATKRGIQR